METKSILVGVAITLLIVGAIGAGGYAATNMGSSNATPAESQQQTPQPTQQAVSEDNVSDQVASSLDGAKALKLNLSESETFAESNVSINPQTGEVVVAYASEAENGPALKEEMSHVAMRYATVVGDHPDTGGLIVFANGVKLMVSSDAAESYDDGKLKDDAYKQTFHWGSVSQGDTKTQTAGGS